MCYWMMEKRFGATKESTHGKTTEAGKTEKATSAKDAVIARRQSEEKASSYIKGLRESSAVKEDESVS